MMTSEETRSEFWMLTKGILQDGSVDAEEARVVKRWLEEHFPGGEFSYLVDRLGKCLADGYIDPRESSMIAESVGRVLATLRGAC